MELFDEVFGWVVVSELFAVAVPEFDFAVWEEFDEASGVVEFELGCPGAVFEEGGVFAGYGGVRAWWVDVAVCLCCGHLSSSVVRIRS